MKMNMEDAVSYINQKLNYPSVAYEDLVVFFDQAVAELNTMLNISLEPISRLATLYTSVIDIPNIVELTDAEVNAGIPVLTTPTSTTKFYYNSSDNKYYIKDLSGNWNAYDVIYGVTNLKYQANMNVSSYNYKLFKSWKLANNVMWFPSDERAVSSFLLTDYIAYDWLMLFLIPYVCHSWTARDGGNTLLFAEEFNQGYMQLRKSYNVPTHVTLSECAHLPAYTNIVKEYLQEGVDWSTIKIHTKAITEDMKAPESVEEHYSGPNYENIKKGWF